MFYFSYSWVWNGISLVAQTVKCLPTMQKTQVWSLGWKDPLEKEMATSSNTFVWKIPWTEKPVGLQSMGSQRVGHDWASSLHFSGKELPGQCRRHGFYSWVREIPLRRRWQPTPVFLPEKSHGLRSLAGYIPWGLKRIRHLATKQQQLQMLKLNSIIIHSLSHIH